MASLIAHRGSHEHAPENTLAAFDAALGNGADMIEFDVRRTADHRLAIFHDSEIAKTSLNKLTLEELRRLSGIEVPVLEDVLAWAVGTGAGLDVELKEDGYVDAVAPLLADFPGRLLVTSFVDPVLTQMAQHAPEVQLGLLLSLTSLAAVRRVRDCGAQAAIIKMKLLSDQVLTDLAEAELGAYLWDFLPGRDEQATWLSDDRITGFITDDVPGTRAALGVRSHS